MFRRNKYHAKKVEIDGLKFDSMKEANRYKELILLQKNGYITDLKRQVKFSLIPKTDTERKCDYIADFTYNENGKFIVEDVKGFKTKEYIIKRKLIKWLYPKVTFRES